MCARGHKTIAVRLTPPGDAYPALADTLDTIRSIVDASYGPKVGDKLFPDEKVVLLNDIPAKDKAMEAIVDGMVLGRFFYLPEIERWVLKPTIEGARRIRLLSDSKSVVADEGACKSIIGGSSLLAPGVLEADLRIKTGEEAIVTNPLGEVVAVGSARMNGESMILESHGQAVKVRSSSPPEPPHILPGGQTWRDVAKANESVLTKRETEAVDFIRRQAKRNPGQTCVAFSGGKDSLSTLLLVKKAIDDFKILFVDTGIEFPETVEYTYQVIDELGLTDKLIVESAGNRFWTALDIFGPPSRDARWCCKVCKLGPTTSIIHKVFGGQVLMFVGQRRYESIQRQSRRRVTKNPWVPGQTTASPIQHWTALHVWLYLIREGVRLNPLYGQGYARIGCFMCPASDMWQFRLLEKTHPLLYKKWTDRLRTLIQNRMDRQLDVDRLIRTGLWRWRRPPGWAKEEAISYSSFEKIQRPPISKRLTEDRLSISSLDRPLEDMNRVENALNALGETSREDGLVSTNVRGIHVEVSSDGSLKVGPADSEKSALDIYEKAFSCLVKASYCVGCGTCVGVCPVGAIEIRDGKAWIGPSCTHCSACISLCPLLTWAMKRPSRPLDRLLDYG